MKLIWRNFSYFSFSDEIRKITTVGSLKKVVEAMLDSGLNLEQIETALGGFDDEGHNCAEFGSLNRTFIYSEYASEYDTVCGHA